MSLFNLSVESVFYPAEEKRRRINDEIKAGGILQMVKLQRRG